MIECSTMNNGMNLRLSKGSGMNLSSTPKWRGTGWLNTLRLVVSRRWQCFKDSTKLGEPGAFYVGEGI